VLDLETLRIVQASVAVCAFGLVFFGTYLTTHAPFAGWWSAALGASGLTTVILIMGEGFFPFFTAALGNATSVVGAFFTWMAARSLYKKHFPWWVPAGVGGVVALATFVERPAGDGWPGGAALLVGMSLFVGLAAKDLWTLSRRRDRGANQRRLDREKNAALVSMAVASTAVSGFYALRVVVYVTVGPASWFYETWAGPLATTFLMTLVLLVVTYSVTTLSHDRLARHWRQRAMNDDLTGLLTRIEFGQRGEDVLAELPHGASPAVIVADLDHFKAVNDRDGHAAGDKALVSFAEAVREALGEEDLAARFGGEEFVFLIADADSERVAEMALEIDTVFAKAGPEHSVWPTVSYGAALWESNATLEQLIERADAAMYRAKAAGRAQLVVDEREAR